MNYIGLNLCDMANGPGCRVSLFVSGCTLHCKGCFNRKSWNFNAGLPFTKETQSKILTALSNPYISGLSLLGGDPLEPEHESTLVKLCKAVKEIQGKTIWIWTGRLYEQIKDRELIKYADILIDGPFKKRLHSKDLEYRGSSNQRIINLNKIGG